MRPDTGKWFIYILCCFGGTYYTGITNNINNRVNRHNDGKGAEYTRLRRPVKLVYVEEVNSISEAMRIEKRIKKMAKNKKEALLKQFV